MMLPLSQVGNDQQCAVHFVIPITMAIHSLHFEIFTLVSEIHGHVDLVYGIKILFELEAILNTRDSAIKFLNKSVPEFPAMSCQMKPREKG